MLLYQKPQSIQYNSIRSIILAIAVLFSLSLTNAVNANTMQKKSVCIWDPVGIAGPVFSFFFDLKVKALSWGVDVDMRAYNTEEEVAFGLLTGNCDSAIITSFAARYFVKFAGSLDAIGGITNDDQLKRLLQSLNNPEVKDLLVENDFEVIALLPVGSMYAFVNDRNITTIGDLKNKKIAVMEGDVQIEMFAEIAQARTVKTTLSQFSKLFIDEKVDVVMMPALAYNAFELYRALGKTGGILDLRVFNGMLQGIVRRSQFEDDFGSLMRDYINSRFNDIVNIIQTAESKIPEHYWIRANPRLEQSFTDLFKDTRLHLKLENKLHPQALMHLWDIRCQTNPKRSECIMPK